MAALTANQKELLEEVLEIAGDDPKEVDHAVRTVLGRHFRGPAHNGSRGFHYRLLSTRAKNKIAAVRRNAARNRTAPA